MILSFFIAYCVAYVVLPTHLVLNSLASRLVAILRVRFALDFVDLFLMMSRRLDESLGIAGCLAVHPVWRRGGSQVEGSL